MGGDTSSTLGYRVDFLYFQRKKNRGWLGAPHIFVSATLKAIRPVKDNHSNQQLLNLKKGIPPPRYEMFRYFFFSSFYAGKNILLLECEYFLYIYIISLTILFLKKIYKEVCLYIIRKSPKWIFVMHVQMLKRTICSNVVFYKIFSCNLN